MPDEKSARRRGVLLVLVATVLWSLAGLFARLLAHLDVWTVMGWRALLGAASIATSNRPDRMAKRAPRPTPGLRGALAGRGAARDDCDLRLHRLGDDDDHRRRHGDLRDAAFRRRGDRLPHQRRARLGPHPSPPQARRSRASSSWWRAGSGRGVSWGRLGRC